MLGITRDDDIYFEEIVNRIENYGTTKSINKLETDPINRLHIKSMEDAINEIDANLDFEEFTQEEVQEIADVYNEIKINPEYKYYKNDQYELDECYDTNEDNIFEIFNNSDIIINSNLLYEPPSFETLIYMGETQNVVFRTQLTNNQPFYRVNIRDKGCIELNIIGTKIKYYTVDFENVKLKKNNEYIMELM